MSDAALVNDTWAGHDPRLPEVAGRHGARLVCSHTGGAQPRTLPHRVRYGDSPDGVVTETVACGGRRLDASPSNHSSV